MRNISKTAAALAVLLAGGTAANAATFGGNGATGFSGPIGNGSLEITELDGFLTFKVTPSGSLSGNKVALYLDTLPGGFSSTASFTDTQDYGRSIITGGNSDLNFAAGFGADFAISINPDDYIGVFGLTNPADYSFVTGTGSAATPYTVTATRAQLGLNATDGFSIVGSLTSGDFYRSNETFGNSVTAPEAGATPNAGFTGSVTFTDALVYPAAAAVPEPASIGLVGLGLTAFAMRRRRAM